MKSFRSVNPYSPSWNPAVLSHTGVIKWQQGILCCFFIIMLRAGYVASTGPCAGYPGTHGCVTFQLPNPFIPQCPHMVWATSGLVALCANSPLTLPTQSDTDQ